MWVLLEDRPHKTLVNCKHWTQSLAQYLEGGVANKQEHHGRIFDPGGLNPRFR